MKFILNEDFFEDDLPEVTDADITISADELTEPLSHEDVGVVTLLSDALKGELDTINDYNSIIEQLSEQGGYDSIINILRDINKEENIHVGQLQAAIKSISSDAEQIDLGIEEAEKDLFGDDLDISDIEDNDNSLLEEYKPDFSGLAGISFDNTSYYDGGNL